MCAMLSALAVSARPNAHKSDPKIATFRYENSFSSGPTRSPERFIITSNVLIINAAPVVPTSRFLSMSPNRRPKDGSMLRVANCVFLLCGKWKSFNEIHSAQIIRENEMKSDGKWELTLTKLTPKVAIQPYPPSGATFLVCFNFSICSALKFFFVVLKKKFNCSKKQPTKIILL